MIALQTEIPKDTWIVATWDKFVQTLDDPAYQKAKGYYYKGQMRIEDATVGPNHAKDNGIMAVVVTLFAAIKDIPLNCLENCTYRKPRVRGC